VGGAVDAEGLAKDAQLEGGHAIEGKHCDVGQHRHSVPPLWQKINALRHFCHWWQNREGRRLTAMTTIAFLILMIAALAALRVWVRHDDYVAPRQPVWFD
jgi:hypothetical protein